MTMPTMPSKSSMATGSQLGARTGGPKVNWGKSSGGFKTGQMQQFTPEQMQLFQQMFGHLGPDSFLGRLAGGDQSQFEEMEAPAWQDFQAGLGQLGSRFAGMGSGSMKSSGFKNTGTAAASQFAQQLQGNRMNVRNNAIESLMNMSNNLLQQKPYENFVTEKKPSWLESMFGSLLGAGGSAFSGWATGKGFGR
jgi:hypothetical protein